jgi:hypothetical protein
VTGQAGPELQQYQQKVDSTPKERRAINGASPQLLGRPRLNGGVVRPFHWKSFQKLSDKDTMFIRNLHIFLQVFFTFYNFKTHFAPFLPKILLLCGQDRQ